MLHLLISLVAASAANETSIAYYESPSMVSAPQGFRFSTIERLKLAASAPKAIEEALRAQRERLKRRKCVKAVCPNPYRRARRSVE